MHHQIHARKKNCVDETAISAKNKICRYSVVSTDKNKLYSVYCDGVYCDGGIMDDKFMLYIPKLQKLMNSKAQLPVETNAR